MVIADFANLPEWDRERRRTQFVVGEDNFADLQINDTGNASGFHFLTDRSSSQLVKEFVLERTRRTLTYCEVKLIGRDGTFEPRLFLKKDSLTNTGWVKAKERIENVGEPLLVKAAVNLDKAHENFWRLVSFLASVKEISVPGQPMVIVDEEAAGLVSLLARDGKAKVIEVLKTAMSGEYELTEADVRLLVDRKAALREFEKLLLEDGYIGAAIAATGVRGEEPFWQYFFENHPWIFGYGLKLVGAEGLIEGKLEQVTRGSNAFKYGGDRVDALLATRGRIQSLMFVEIKKASTDLTSKAPYRSGVYPPSSELSGAVAQVQATTQQAIEALGGPLFRPVGEDGLEREPIGTVRPRQVVVIGSLDQLCADGSINVDRFRSFELYRRSLADVEVITFDELLARARFIAHHDDDRLASDVASSVSASPVAPNSERAAGEWPSHQPPPSDDDVPF